jgi:transposase
MEEIPGDSNASSKARLFRPNPKRITRRTPADSKASTQRSERTPSHEDSCIRSTREPAALKPQPQKRNKPVKEIKEITHYAGLDWAKEHHEVVIVDREGKIVEQFTIDHNAEGWKRWQQRIATYKGNLGVGIETSQGAVIEQLLKSECTIYPIQPRNAKRYRERKISSGNKTDFYDSWAIADALRVDGHGWRALAPQDPLISELRLLCRDEISLIEKRTALVNQLQSALYEYYPAALEAFQDWTMPAAWAFIEAFPTAQKLTSSGKRAWEKFLYKNKLFRPETYEKRMEIFQNAIQLLVREEIARAKSRLALTLVRMLQTLHTQLEAYRAEIEKLFAEHPDSNLFGSLPGVGDKLGPRLLGEIGSDRSLFASPQGLQCVAGTAPVSYQSGQIHKVYLRRHCNKQLRSTVHLWANLSRQSCLWAETYYRALRDRGKSHACALLALGQRWLKILWKMWQSHSPYDPDLHTKNQLQHGSWVLKLIPS